MAEINIIGKHATKKRCSEALFHRAIDEDGYNIEEEAWDWVHMNNQPEPKFTDGLLFFGVTEPYTFGKE
jgi:hypothetical protein